VYYSGKDEENPDFKTIFSKKKPDPSIGQA
jgi:hypothetical protein